MKKRADKSLPTQDSFSGKALLPRRASGSVVRLPHTIFFLFTRFILTVCMVLCSDQAEGSPSIGWSVMCRGTRSLNELPIEGWDLSGMPRSLDDLPIEAELLSHADFFFRLLMPQAFDAGGTAA